MNEQQAKVVEVVAGLLVRGDRVLICQRSASSPFPLKWEFPGGKIEPTEKPVEALRRELREELAIEVVECREIFRHLHHYRGMPAVALCFYQILTYRGEVKNLIFHQIGWAKLEQLADFDFLEGDLPLIKKLATSHSSILAI